MPENTKTPEVESALPVEVVISVKTGEILAAIRIENDGTQTIIESPEELAALKASIKPTEGESNDGQSV